MIWLRSKKLPLALASLLLLASVATAEENKALNWPSRIIQLKPESAEAKPPVVSALSLHPAGTLLATAGDDHLVRVWDLAKGVMLHRLDAHVDWVRAIAFSPAGDVLASAGNDKQIIFWDARTGEKLKVFVEHPQAVSNIAFSHDGKFLVATGFEEKVRVYDVTLGKLVMELTGTCPDMRAIAFSPDDRLLAAGGRCGTVRIWDMSKGEVAMEDRTHTQRVRSLEFSPDGSLLASCSEDRQVVIRPLHGDAKPFTLPRRPAKVMALTFCGDTQLATAGSDNLIRIWDLGSQQEIGRLTGHTGTVAAVVYGSKTLISAGFDTTVRVWKMENLVAEQPPVTVPRVGRLPEAFQAD